MLSHTLDHARGLAATFEEERVIFSSISLTRPALESAGMVFYLLDPCVDERERIRRWANVDLAGNVERIRMLDDERSFEANRLRLGNDLSQLMSRADQEGFRAVRPSRRDGLFGDRYLHPRLPTDQRVIVDLLHDVGEGSAMGKLVHRMTSAITHGSVHGLTLFIAAEQAVQQGDGSSIVPISQTYASSALWSASMLWGLRTCFQRAGGFYGWDTARWDRAVSAALADWRGWIQPLAAG